MYKTIKETTSAEITEKKSKFIANIFYIESREEAEGLIKQYEKKYHDARHNCYAYRIFSKNGITEKFSDAGEPSGTAGAPILNILSKKNLVNILVIVTRYFGGILLGTGGLVKAYSLSCTMALEKANITDISIAKLYKVEIDYSDVDKFNYFCKNNNIIVKKQEYFSNVVVQIAIEEEKDIINMEKNLKIKNKEFIKEIYA